MRRRPKRFWPHWRVKGEGTSMFPESLTFNPAPAISRAVESLVANYGSGFRVLGDGLLTILVALEQVLRGMPWWLIVISIAALAYAASRRPSFSAAAGAALVVIGMLGLWDQAMQTLALMILATAFSALLGVP